MAPISESEEKGEIKGEPKDPQIFSIKIPCWKASAPFCTIIKGDLSNRENREKFLFSSSFLGLMRIGQGP